MREPKNILIRLIDKAIGKLLYGFNHPVGYSETNVKLHYLAPPNLGNEKEHRFSNRNSSQTALSGQFPHNSQANSQDIPNIPNGSQVILDGSQSVPINSQGKTPSSHSFPLTKNAVKTKRNKKVSKEVKALVLLYGQRLEAFFVKYIKCSGGIKKWTSTPSFISYRIYVEDIECISRVLSKNMRSVLLASLNKKSVNIFQDGSFINVQIPFKDVIGNILYSDFDGMAIGFQTVGCDMLLDIYDDNIDVIKPRNCNLLIVSKMGGGKSNIVKNIIMRLSSNYGVDDKCLMYISDLHGDYIELDGAPGIINSLYHDTDNMGVDELNSELAHRAYSVIQAAHDEMMARSQFNRNPLTVLVVEEVLQLLSPAYDYLTHEHRDDIRRWLDNLSTGGRKFNMHLIFVAQKGNLDDIPQRGSFINMIYGAIDTAQQPSTGIPKAEIDLSRLGIGDLVFKQGNKDVVRFQGLLVSDDCMDEFIKEYIPDSVAKKQPILVGSSIYTDDDFSDRMRAGVKKAIRNPLTQADMNCFSIDQPNTLTFEVVQTYIDGINSGMSGRNITNENGFSETFRKRGSKMANYLIECPEDEDFIIENIDKYVQVVEPKINTFNKTKVKESNND